jgi:regulator of replication initiation timing
LILWLENGQSLIDVLLEFFDEHDRLGHQAETAKRDCERLREETTRLQAENDRFRREREEIAELLSKVNDVFLRLREPQRGGWTP